MYPSMIVVLITGYAEENLFPTGNCEGFYFIQKPFTSSEPPGYRRYWEESMPDNKLETLMAELQAIELWPQSRLCKSLSQGLPLLVIDS